MKRVPKKQIKYEVDKTAVAAGCKWDDSELKQFVKFAKQFCIQSQGEWSGKGLELFPFQIDDIFGPLLSWKKPDGSYRFSQASIWTPKKLGKSTCISALCAWKATCFKDQQIFVVSAKQEQARIIFDTVKEFTRHPALKQRWHVKDHKSEIIDRETGSRIKVLACTGQISGFSADLFVLDELAEFGNHIAQTLYDRIIYAGAAKPNSQIVNISTPAHNTDHLGYRQYKRAEKIINNDETEDTTLLPVIYGIPADQDAFDERNWTKKNLPHIGLTVPKDFYVEAVRRAKTDINEEISARIYLFGQYVRNKNQFFDVGKWKECSVDPVDLSGKPACIGFDNGGANDLLGLSILVPHEDKVHVIPKAYLSETALHKKIKTGQVEYQAWVNQGLIEVIPSETITFDSVLRILEKIYQDYDVKALAYDPWHLAELEDEYTKLNRLTIETPQYGKITSPLIMDLERRIAEQTIAHFGHPILNFCIENMQVKENKYGKLEYTKEDSRSKIDLAVSTIVGLNALPEVLNPTPLWELPSIFSL